MKRLTRRTAAVLAALMAGAGGMLADSATSAQAADVLLSKGKPVTVSSVEAAAYSAAKAVDGDTTTRWASAEGRDSEWITVDLGASAKISRIVLNWEAAYARGYRIQVSDNASTWRTAYTTTTGDGGTDDLTVSDSARYIRVQGTQRATAWGYSLWEFQVYGSPPAAGGWQVSWQDEFNDAQGTRPDPAKWVYDLGGEPQWGNEEWQYYANRTQNVSQDGAGNLAITARREQLPGMEDCQVGSCDITSGRITTKGKFDQAYGRFEANIKVPSGQGMWPAFWMMGKDIDDVGWPNNGEIDVMEVVGKEPGTLYGTMHGPGFPAEGIGGKTTLPGGAKFSDAFHVFSVEWSPEQVTWQLDGRTYFTSKKSELPSGAGWVFDHPFYLLVNLAVGGVWPGPPDSTTKFPATLLVDYVRVYTQG
ncbi:family 16 glycosylhydrolase [Streptomyces sp. KR80]|uniref:family 16 glycosylhydrolase n=1 Tax=Streptomyces sp. KR80 TaxID=3457426 RepID=UPI003FD046BE